MNLNLDPLWLNIISILGIIIVLLLIKNSFKNLDKTSTDEFNANLIPGEISTLTFGNMYFVKSITATMLDLHKRNKIKLTVLDDNYKIEFKSNENLERSEEYFLSFLQKINNDILTSKEILKERRSAPDDFNMTLQNYFDLIEESLVEKKLNRKNDIKKPITIILISLALLVLSIIITSLKSFLSIIIIPLSLVLAFNETKKIFSKTKAGDKLQREYLKIAEDVKNNTFNFKNSNIDFTTLIALGIKNEKLSKLYDIKTYSEYENLFNINNLVFADKKSR